MNTLTPKESKLKDLINSLYEYANEAIKISKTKKIGLSIINSLELEDAVAFLSRREEWLKDSYTNNLPNDMKQKLEDYLKAAQLLVKAKDSLDLSFSDIKVLEELKSSLEYVVDGYYSNQITLSDANFGTKVPERFKNKWLDLSSIEVGFKCLHKVSSDSDYKFCITVSKENTILVIDSLYSLVRKSLIERYIISEGEQASEKDKIIWRNIYKLLRAIKKIVK